MRHYEDPSYFSRDSKKMFGASLRLDIAKLRTTSELRGHKLKVDNKKHMSIYGYFVIFLNFTFIDLPSETSNST